ncbi:MAG: sulfite exporter TauE/SafE family protein [Brumimicrobium sp.]
MGEIATIVLTAFSLGLVTNLHCIGMCGPIAMALPLNRKNKWSIAGGVTSYSLGRSLGYATLGVIVGLIGVSAKLLGTLQWISIVSGILIVVFAWGHFYNISKKSNILNKWIMRAMSRLLKNRSKKTASSRLIGIGLINAFLPCGMVYIALITALNTGNLANSTLFMFVFGLGTLPGFLFLGNLKDFFSRMAFFNKRVVLASLISIVGLFMVLRGMNLGIPYISPKMEMMTAKSNSDSDKNPTIEAKMSCCSEKNTASCEKE